MRTGSFPAALAVGAGFVWVVNAGDGTVARIDPREDVVIGRRIPVGRDPQDIAVGHGSVWVANRGDGTVTRLSARTGRPQGSPISVGGAPGALAVTREGVLVLDTRRGDVWARSPDRPAEPRLARRRLPDLARRRRRQRLGRRRAQRDRHAAAGPLSHLGQRAVQPVGERRARLPAEPLAGGARIQAGALHLARPAGAERIRSPSARASSSTLVSRPVAMLQQPASSLSPAVMNASTTSSTKTKSRVWLAVAVDRHASPAVAAAQKIAITPGLAAGLARAVDVGQAQAEGREPVQLPVELEVALGGGLGRGVRRSRAAASPSPAWGPAARRRRSLRRSRPARSADAVAPRGLEHRHGADQVDRRVARRVGDRVADVDLGGEMEDRVGPRGGEDAVDRGGIGDARRGWKRAPRLSAPGEVLPAARREVVEDRDTLSPRASSASTRCEPMNPAPPVTSALPISGVHAVVGGAHRRRRRRSCPR